MSLTSEYIGDILVLALDGQLNSANATETESALLPRVEQGESRCVLDLSRLDYISSAGLRVILMLAKRIRQNSGSLVLSGLQPQVREVFAISGFLTMLSVAENRAAALDRLATGPGAPGG